MSKPTIPCALILISFLVMSSVAAFSQADSVWHPVGPPGDNIIEFEYTSNGVVYAESRWHVYRRLLGESLWKNIPHLDTLERTDGSLPFIALDDVLIAFIGCCNTSLSFDKGNTWISGSTFSPQSTEYSLYPAAVTVGDTIFMSRSSKDGILYASVDSGQSWSVVDSLSISDLATDGERLFLLVANPVAPSLYVREEGSWRSIGPESAPGKEILVAGDTIVYTNYGMKAGIRVHYRSFDEGASWEKLPVLSLYKEDFYNGHIWGVYLNGVFSIPPDGNDWEHLYQMEEFTGAATLAFGGDTLYLGNHLGVYSLVPGQTDPVYDTAGIYAYNILRIEHLAGSLVAFNSSTLFFNDTTTDTWKRMYLPQGGRDTYFEIDSDRMYLTTKRYEVLWRSNDGGHNWEELQTITGAGAIHAEDNLIFVAGNGINRSRDDGITWEKMPSFQGSEDPDEFTGVGDTIFAFGSYLTSDKSIASFYRTLNGGNQWEAIASPIPAEAAPLKLQFNGHSLFAVGSKGTIYRSNDVGDTWEPLLISSLGMFDSLAVATYLQVINDTVLVYGTPFFSSQQLAPQIFLSSDNGATWLSIESPGSPVNDFHLEGNNLYVATPSRAVLVTRLAPRSSDSTSHVQEINGIASGTMYFVHPNQLVVVSDRPMKYSVELLRTDGRHIRTLVTGTFDPGSYRHALDLSDLLSGTYVAILRSENSLLALAPITIIR